ncbi:MAG: Hsp20/alpha crystallin family protein [Spirochaetaceae bacterium]|nr:Hsp20/alpha crystallin family protein [Spirochaetaceae bacterium]
MKDMTLYGTNPVDLISQMFDDDGFFFNDFRTPAVDVRESDNSYAIEAELPGLTEKDVHLELKDGQLVLSTAKTESKDEKSEKEGKNQNRWLRRERRSFKFSRSFVLPEDADTDKIEAKFRDGLLTINLPKKAEMAPKMIPVNIG